MRARGLAFSRRGLLAGAACLPFSRAAFGAAFDTEVVVIGAGAAGLAAARELIALKRDVVVLESSGRVGGRLFTETGLGAPYDAGGRYIHWAERNPWTNVAREFGAQTSSEETRGFRFFDKGALRPSDPSRRARMSRVGERLDGENVADVSIAQAVADDPLLGEAAQALARLSLGEEPQRVSARDYARLWSGDDLEVPSGYGALAERFGAGAPIRLNARARRIDWSGAGVAISTEAGDIRAKKAIVTTSIGVLKSGAIRFAPDLPAATRDALNGLEMGALSKVGLAFDFARTDIPPGDIFTRESEAGGFNLDCRPFGRDIVVAVFGGDFARDVARTDEAAIAHALEALARCVGASARGAFRGGRAHAWFRDADARGCYSHCLPGHAQARAALAEPVGDRLFFAGEATGAIGGAMTAGGAVLAGRAAARAAAGAPAR